MWMQYNQRTVFLCVFLSELHALKEAADTAEKELQKAQKVFTKSF